MTIFVFGEAMLEYHSRGASAGLRYGGDTLNTAIHLARMGCRVAYVTAVGTDPISDALVAGWASEGIDTSFVLRHPMRSPGIYAIHLDQNGERSFLTWRDQSAAREMFALPAMQAALDEARNAELLYFSLISLAILPQEGRERLLELAAGVRAQGDQVAYDSNFRRNLWPDLEQARAVSESAMGTATIGLPTDVDERQLYVSALTEREIASRWIALGCQEVVVKVGERGCLLVDAHSGGEVMPPSSVVQVVDTSGAGDAFNAGYLGARLRLAQGKAAAVERGQQLARWVIARMGALPAIDAEAPYAIESARPTHAH
ncbi:sugar kinase [Steroidobacter agaridevorans]|uniref:sugar kinase n=1 Tax=Steroidobacter agaridevorans TaxID=2695856 RepID=UPI001325E2C3|nr:sugar kinase [Steroidobacter agaridevorans]GFE87734.1 2-dehydro-3-deoxygluconokinase [Steroidobacter agaridevorans]